MESIQSTHNAALAVEGALQPQSYPDDDDSGWIRTHSGKAPSED